MRQPQSFCSHDDNNEGSDKAKVSSIVMMLPLDWIQGTFSRNEMERLAKRQGLGLISLGVTLRLFESGEARGACAGVDRDWVRNEHAIAG